MECNICAFSFSNLRKHITCSSCNNKCCTICFKKFLLESNNLIPICMFCNKNLTYTFVRENTPVSWANLDYIKKRSQNYNKTIKS